MGVESLDKNTQGIIGRIVHWSAQLVHPLIPRPLSRPIQECGSNVLVLNRFEKAEKGCSFVMEPVVIVVENGCDTANAFAIAQGEKQFCGGMGKKWIPGLVEKIPDIADQGWHPKRIFAVNFPRKPNKLSQVPATRRRSYFNSTQSFLFPEIGDRLFLSNGKILFDYRRVVFKSSGDQNIHVGQPYSGLVNALIDAANAGDVKSLKADQWNFVIGKDIS